MSWLMVAYIKEKNYCAMLIRDKIPKVTSKLVQNSFIYRKSHNLEKFTETTLVSNYNKLSVVER